MVTDEVPKDSWKAFLKLFFFCPNHTYKPCAKLGVPPQFSKNKKTPSKHFEKTWPLVIDLPSHHKTDARKSS